MKQDMCPLEADMQWGCKVRIEYGKEAALTLQLSWWPSASAWWRKPFLRCGSTREGERDHNTYDLKYHASYTG